MTVEQVVKTLKNLCKMTEEELFTYMTKVLQDYYKKVTIGPDYMFAEGDIPCCLLAHCDIAFPQPPQEIYYDTGAMMMWGIGGLGSDDRAGIFAILQILEWGYRPSIILTLGEEKGGIGATSLAKAYPQIPFKDVRMLIQLDRANEKDCVFYHCDNQDFVNYIQNFGFVYAEGTFTDISILMSAWKIPSVNLSVGYLFEHTPKEHLSVYWLYKTIEKVVEILRKGNAIPSFEYKEKEYPQQNFSWSKNSCLQCRKRMRKEDIKHHVTGKDIYGAYSYWLCDNCYQGSSLLGPDETPFL